MTVSDLKIYKVKHVAELLQRDRAEITKLICSGVLKGFNANPTGKYRKLRVTESALLEFIEANQVKKPAGKRRRGRTAAKPVKDYF